MAGCCLVDILPCAFRGVDHIYIYMLTGKNFTYNFRALRLLVETVIQNTVQEANDNDDVISRLQYHAICSTTANVWAVGLIKPIFLITIFLPCLALPCLALPWSLSSTRSRRGASWRTSPSALSSPAGYVPWLESLRRVSRSTPRCCQSSYFSVCHFFACLRLFPIVSLWLGRPILSLPIPFQFSPLYSCQMLFWNQEQFHWVPL